MQSDSSTTPSDSPDQVLEMIPLPSAGPWPTQDPFLFCVHHNDHYPAGNSQLGPDMSGAGRHIGHDFSNLDGWSMYHGTKVPGFPRHPHRGFETVTIVEAGVIDHADSLGAAARYGAGDVQWLTAGVGINHSEMFPLLNRDGPNPTDFFQIWMNLPSASKLVEPSFRMFWNEQIPQIEHIDDDGLCVRVKVVCGAYKSAMLLQPPPNSWARDSGHDVAIWSVHMDGGATWTTPAINAGVNRSVYVVSDSGIAIGQMDIPGRHRVSMSKGSGVPIKAGRDGARLLLLQGCPIAQPVAAHGPFVMNTQQEIMEAYHDYRSTQFGGWPWPSDGPVHSDQPRFATYPDGTTSGPCEES